MDILAITAMLNFLREAYGTCFAVFGKEGEFTVILNSEVEADDASLVSALSNILQNIENRRVLIFQERISRIGIFNQLS